MYMSRVLMGIVMWKSRGLGGVCDGWSWVTLTVRRGKPAKPVWFMIWTRREPRGKRLGMFARNLRVFSSSSGEEEDFFSSARHISIGWGLQMHLHIKERWSGTEAPYLLSCSCSGQTNGQFWSWWSAPRWMLRTPERGGHNEFLCPAHVSFTSSL